MGAGVFVLGSFVVDCAYRAERMPASGETVIGRGFALGPGGKGSNQAVAAARAGAAVTLQTAVGRDAFGEIGRQMWREDGIDASLVKAAEVPTGSAAILLDEASGANRIIVVPGACDALQPADVDAAAAQIRAAKVFLAQLELPVASVVRGLALAREANAVTVLNPAPAPHSPLPTEVLRAVDFLVPNESEAESLTGIKVQDAGSAEQAARKLQQAGAAQVVVTLGERGAVYLNEAGALEAIPAFALGAVLDTTGAGDAFCGAFAAALAEDMAPGPGLRFASAAAGLSVLQHGAARSMARRKEIEAVLRQHSRA